MLIQLITQHPQALGTVLKSTPPWVWGLFAALLALGLSQVRSRRVSLARSTLTPVVMVGLSLWGTVNAFSASPLFVQVLLAWLVGAVLMLGLIAAQAAPAGTRFDPATRSFHMPGSWVPLVLILGIFLTKYTVGVDMSMQPALALDGQYALVVSGLYGLFSGIFAGRTLRLWRLLRRSSSATTATPIVNA